MENYSDYEFCASHLKGRSTFATNFFSSNASQMQSEATLLVWNNIGFYKQYNAAHHYTPFGLSPNSDLLNFVDHR